MQRRRQIIALGGGGFARGNPDLKMGAYILEQTGRRHPRVCFVPTAGGDDARSIEQFHKNAKRLGARPSHLSLFNQPLEPLRSFVLRHDAIYVGGGNTRNMLVLWRAWALDRILRAAYEAGVVLAGSSAGALCWFSAGVTDSYPGRFQELSCLGWLRGSFCPHYDSEAKRKPVYRRLVRSGTLAGGYAADDNVGLHYIGERLTHIVSSRPKARAYRLVRRGGRAVEEAVDPDVRL
jgi:dipeptidase E